MNIENLTGKTAVITGASSGIGEAAARQLAAEGVKMILVARREDRICALAEELGDGVTAMTADVGDLAQVQRVFAQAKERFGGLDLLFNNAGIGIYGDFLESTPESWKAQIDANIYGVLNCTHAGLPLMLDRPGAMVATVSSVSGRYGFAEWPVYAATKHAVIGLNDSLRKAYGERGVRFLVIEPGSVWTEWGDNTPDGMLEKRRESLDALTAGDIAAALVYAFGQPPRVLVEEMLIRPVRQLVP